MTKGALKHRPEDDSEHHAAVTVPAPPSVDPHEPGPQIFGTEGLASTTAVAPTPGIPNYGVDARSVAVVETPTEEEEEKPLSLDDAIPVRRRASVDGAPLRPAFLLSHVDNQMSIAEIARSAQIPIAEAIECFMLLADLGVVELRAPSVPPTTSSTDDSSASRPPTLKSGLHKKY
jgi:hypothetical protein